MNLPEARRVAVIIDDEPDIRHLLEKVLVQAGFDTIGASSGPDGIEAVRTYQPVVTTLDVNMPGMDGFEVARRIRAFSPTYLLMLTAQDEEIDALQGLEAGADDYIAKPFRPRELRARIDAMLRRQTIGSPMRPGAAGPAAGPAPAATAGPAPAGAAAVPSAPAGPPASPAALPDSVHPGTQTPPATPATTWHVTQPVPPAALPPYAAPGHAAHGPSIPREPAPPTAAPAQGQATWRHHNGLRLNPDERMVFVDSEEVQLTRTEFDLLSELLESGRRVRSKAELALAMRGESYVTSHYVTDADRRAIEVHMANLRRKLADNVSSPRFIETVRGIGYRLTAPL